MSVGVQLSEPSKVALLGLGGGGLAMFLKKCFINAKIIAVDLDPAMLEVAKKHFELETDDRLEVQIKDGMDFLIDEADSGKIFLINKFLILNV